MFRKTLAICLIFTLIAAPLISLAPADVSTEKLVAQVRALGMFQTGKFGDHLRVQNIDQIASLLESKAIPLSKATPAARDAAIKEYRSLFLQKNPTTPNPEKLRELLLKERQGTLGALSAEAAPPQIMSLAVPVEFPNSDTFDWCGSSVTTEGPLHNQIPPPGPRDNNTIWYQDATPEMYDELYFGVGPNAGVIVHHPNLGDVDLRGNTMANYYLEQSEGSFSPQGLIYPKWLQAAHSEGWYGADSCSGSNHHVRAKDLVREVVDAINADDPSFAWQTYDGDANGVIDNFTVIHAGMGQEGGGGLQGTFSIWSHASAIDYPSGKLACAAGSAGCPDRDIYVREYSMDPENIDIGVIAEEFGHAAFGLPDIYTTDAQGSPSNWAIMESGSWNGILGGMQPAPFPLVFRYLVGWAHPQEYNYDVQHATVKVGQLSKRPWGTSQGIKVNMPDTVIETPNPLGTGQAWWSDRADLADFYLAHDFDLTAATAPIFSFASYWSFEADYDYGYVEVSEDGGATWTPLPDMDGIFVDDGSGVLGLNGEGQGTLRFDLTAYAGKAITLRLFYTSDVGVQWAGWFADDFLLADGATTLFTDDVESPPGGWTTNNFVIVPLTRIFPLYYMAEWRNLSGFDRGLMYPYTTIYSNDATNEWEVDRCPYTVPGMLLWLRNGAYDFDYTLYDSLYDSPSWGPKHALLVVDSHFWPLEWEGMGTSGVHLRLNSRCQPGNSTFTLQKTTPFTARRASSTATGNVVETKTFEPLPGVSQFHDLLGYQPGLRYHIPAPGEDPDNEGLWWWDTAASLVVPSTGNYSTRITWDDKTPATDLYGIDIGTVLGSGNPGDDGVQYGLNLAVVDKARDGSWGLIKVWNSSAIVDLDKYVGTPKAKPGWILKYTLKVTNKTPVLQQFEVKDPIPEHTRFFWSWWGTYDKDNNQILWKGWLLPRQTAFIQFWVKVEKPTPTGTIITNNAYLTDGGIGDTASVTTEIVSPSIHLPDEMNNGIDIYLPLINH